MQHLNANLDCTKTIFILFCFEFFSLCSFWLLALCRSVINDWSQGSPAAIWGKRLVQCHAVQNRAIKSLKHQFPSVWFGPFFYLWQSFIMARVQGKFFAITLFHYPATLPAASFFFLLLLLFHLSRPPWGGGGSLSRHLNQSWVCILKARFVHLFYLLGAGAFMFIIPRLIYKVAGIY